MNYLYAALAAMALLIGAEQFGEHRIQALWDIETERLEAVAEQVKVDDENDRIAIAERHRRDIQNAKSEAGRKAIRNYIRTRGMLPTNPAACGQTDGAGGADGAAAEPGLGNSLEEFASRCGQDALKVLAWQEWAIRQGLEVK